MPYNDRSKVKTPRTWLCFRRLERFVFSGLRVTMRITRKCRVVRFALYTCRLHIYPLCGIFYFRAIDNWVMFKLTGQNVERSSSVVECRTRNRESPGSNPPLLPFRRLGIFRSLHRRPCSLSCINEYLAIDSGGNVSDLVLARNCCLVRYIKTTFTFFLYFKLYLLQAFPVRFTLICFHACVHSIIPHQHM